MKDRPSRDRGQAMPIVLGVVAVAMVLVMALGQLARRTADAARAQSAADATALAGAAAGRAAAADLAAENHATLLSYASSGRSVTVTVRVGSATATARADLEADDRQIGSPTRASP